MGMPATGRSVTVKGIDIIRFGEDGLAHEHWGVFDILGMMQQLGVVPEAPPTWAEDCLTCGQAHDDPLSTQATFPHARALRGAVAGCA